MTFPKIQEQEKKNYEQVLMPSQSPYKELTQALGKYWPSSTCKKREHVCLVLNCQVSSVNSIVLG